MTSPRLRSLQAAARTWAGPFRDRAAALDSCPDEVGDLVDLDGCRFLSTAGIPERFGGKPLEIDGFRHHVDTALERVVVIEELARGDAGVLLASPGPSMSGVLMAELAGEEQYAAYCARLLARPTWTFFALTEPDHGSDAGAMTTSVDRLGDAVRLDGTKCYVGNAARAGLGIVFARTGTGPLAVGAVLVEPPHPGLVVSPMPTVGLRGAQLSELVMSGVERPASAVVGGHLPPSRRGLRACLQVFNQLRPGVAAIGVGVAAAAVDHVREQWPRPPAAFADRLDAMDGRVAVARELVLDAARAADHGADGSLASAAKAHAARLAEEITLEAVELLGPAACLEHPVLDRLVRHARGVEFMEGTRNIQLLNAFRGLRAARTAGPTRR